MAIWVQYELIRPSGSLVTAPFVPLGTEQEARKHIHFLRSFWTAWPPLGSTMGSSLGSSLRSSLGNSLGSSLGSCLTVWEAVQLPFQGASDRRHRPKATSIKMQRPISRFDCPSARGGLHMAPPGFRILTNLAKTPLESGL